MKFNLLERGKRRNVYSTLLEIKVNRSLLSLHNRNNNIKQKEGKLDLYTDDI